MKAASIPTTGLISNCAGFRGEKVVFLFEISMRCNGFGYLKHSLVLAVQEIRLSPLELLGLSRLS